MGEEIEYLKIVKMYNDPKKKNIIKDLLEKCRILKKYEIEKSIKNDEIEKNVQPKEIELLIKKYDELDKLSKMVHIEGYKTSCERHYLELEKKLFECVDTDSIYNRYMYPFDYMKLKKIMIKKYNELLELTNLFTQDRCNSNFYLKYASIYMKTSIEDCKLFIRKFRKKFSNLDPYLESELENEHGNLVIEIKVNIPKERLKVFPTIRDNYDLSKECLKLNTLAKDIYELQLWNLLSNYPEKILPNINYYIGESEQFFIASFVRRKDEKQKVKKK